MRRTISAVALLSTSALAPSLALAEDGTGWASKTGALGVGADVTLGGSEGMHVRYLVIPDLEIGATIGFSSASGELAGESQSEMTFDLGVYAGWHLASSQRASLAAIGGIDVQYVNVETAGVGDSATDFLVGLGMQAEWYPTEYLSLFAQAGLSIDPLTDPEITDGAIDMSDTGVSLALGSDLWGGAGFTVWFK